MFSFGGLNSNASIGFSAHYPLILKNNERIKEIGIEAWLIEQDELVAKGITNRILGMG